MTIQSAVNDGITHDGNDSATTFSFPFKVDLNTQIEVIVRDSNGDETTKVLNTDYTVSNHNVEGSGSISYPISGDPLPTGSSITITPKMDYLQSTDIRNQGRFAPETHEDAFDTLMMHIKELRGLINRAIKFKKSSELTGAEFGDDPEDNKLIAWDGITGKTKNVTTISTAIVTTFMETLLDDTTAAQGRTTLDAEQIINSLTAITTLQDSDQISIADNSDSDNSKKITFANFILQALLDEDDMASNSATRGATQQSIKAYVDNIPMFKANIGSAQTIAHNTITKLQFDTKSFDTNSWYDNSTSYRYTPQKAGKYLVIAKVLYNNSNNGERLIFIYKNGSRVSQDNVYQSGTPKEAISITSIVEMNGSSDYIEIFSRQTTGGNANTYSGSDLTEFSAIYIGS